MIITCPPESQCDPADLKDWASNVMDVIAGLCGWLGISTSVIRIQFVRNPEDDDMSPVRYDY